MSGEGPAVETSNEFLTLCMRLRAEALLWMGMVKHPETGETTVDLAQAKAAIDILGMLDKKTAGNLSEDEDKVLKGLLADLRLTYVDKSRRA